MNKLYRNWLVYFLIFLLMYIGIKILFSVALGRDLDLLEISINAVVFFVVYTLLQMPSLYFGVKPRLKYLESNDSTKPSFKFICSSVVNVPQEFDFNRLKTEITGNKWLITFFDDMEYVLKFKTKSNFFNHTWGTAAWLKFDNDAGKIYIECFPMSGDTHHSHAYAMQKEIEDCLQKIHAPKKVVSLRG